MIPRPDYNKIIAASPGYEVKNEQYNYVQRSDLDEIVRLLMCSNRRHLYDLGAEYKGSPVRSSYLLHIHPALIEHFIGIMGYISIRMYPSRESALPNEIGTIGNLRIIIDSSLEDFVVNGPEHKNGNCMEDSYICIAQGFSGNEFNKEDYIVIRCS